VLHLEHLDRDQGNLLDEEIRHRLVVSQDRLTDSHRLLIAEIFRGNERGLASDLKVLGAVVV
jgi:hypothetical protein